MKYNAYAKINLYLEIVGINENGYHLLETIFQEISLYDELEFKITNTDEIIINASGAYSVPIGENNLIYKTINLLKKEFKITKGINVNLKKNIPLGAGLGGGSSDAATCIKFFQDYFGKKIKPEIVANLGADIPFFLEGKRAFASNIGDKLSSIKSYKKRYIVLVYPNININTSFIYKNFDELYKNKKYIFKKSLTDMIKKSNLLGTGLDFVLFNRLEEITFPLFPELKSIKSVFDSFKIDSLMSGSGSSIFGVTEDLEKATFVGKYFLTKTNYSVWVLHEI